MPKINPILSDILSAGSENIVHGFYTRHGGTSEGIYESLNVGPSSGDHPQNVSENRKAIVQHMGLSQDDLVTPWQYHSADVVIATKHWGNERPKADGIVTNTPNLPIAIVTADCGPVLFCDPKNNIIAATHAGWRGATGGVLEATVDKMIEIGAARENIQTVLGPTISAKNYEIGPEMVDILLSLSPDNESHLSPSLNANHAMFDLPGYIVTRLKKIDVKANSTGHCTYEDENRFFSYRRMTHRGEPDYGRQISAIAIRP